MEGGRSLLVALSVTFGFESRSAWPICITSRHILAGGYKTGGLPDRVVHEARSGGIGREVEGELRIGREGFHMQMRFRVPDRCRYEKHSEQLITIPPRSRSQPSTSLSFQEFV